MKKLLFLNIAFVLFCSCDIENSDPEEPNQSEEGIKFEAVDLGLSVKWASCNLGATKPEEYGDHFSWGETEPKSDYSSIYYIYGSSDFKYTKYNKKDNKVDLELCDDAAHVKLGGSWRMPTIQECKELISGCNCKFVYNYNGTGVNGLLAKSKFRDTSIFLPAAGDYYSKANGSVGKTGGYWSTFLLNPKYAWHISFDVDKVDLDYEFRPHGYSIRPVCPKD